MIPEHQAFIRIRITQLKLMNNLNPYFILLRDGIMGNYFNIRVLAERTRKPDVYYIIFVFPINQYQKLPYLLIYKDKTSL